MQLINLSNGSILADKIEVADNFKKRLKGLIGRPGLNHGEAFVLLPCKSIHTCFMNFPIDVLFIDKEGRVLRTLEHVKPFKFSPIVSRSYLVVELPAGCIAATGTAAGHQMQITAKEAAS